MMRRKAKFALMGLIGALVLAAGLHPSGSIACPAILNFDYYSFRPSSNVASLCSGTCGQSVTVESSWGLSGSWTGNGTLSSKFATGLYSVVEADEWGDILFIYFTVS